MKNIKIYQRALSLLTATAISITLTSCSEHEKSEETTPVKLNRNSTCTHLTLHIGESYETFKECDDYDIEFKTNYGSAIYKIIKNDQIYFNGVTSDYNLMHINHESYQNENNALQKVKTK